MVNTHNAWFLTYCVLKGEAVIVCVTRLTEVVSTFSSLVSLTPEISLTLVSSADTGNIASVINKKRNLCVIYHPFVDTGKKIMTSVAHTFDTYIYDRC